MPRKPKPPISELRIEALSNGEIVRERIAYDDFTGKPFLLPEHYGPHKPPPDFDALKAQRRHEAIEHKRLLLQAVGILPGLVRPKPEPKLAHNQMQLSNGKVLTVPRNPNALKRRL